MGSNIEKNSETNYKTDAIKKKYILLSISIHGWYLLQKCQNPKFDSAPKIISLFGCTNIILADYMSDLLNSDTHNRKCGSYFLPFRWSCSE